ncbi:MAG: hypothetical protein ACLSVD_05735 [Eggerthellaceae bacterium]
MSLDKELVELGETVTFKVITNVDGMLPSSWSTVGSATRSARRGSTWKAKTVRRRNFRHGARGRVG